MEDSLRATTQEALIGQSQALEDAGEIAAALQAATQAVRLARQGQDPGRIAAALARQAFVEFRLGHYAQAREIAQNVLAIAVPDAPARADALLIRGNVAAETSSLAEAEADYGLALDLCRTIGYPYIHMRALHNLAMGVYFPRGQFDLALKTAQDAGRMALAAGYGGYRVYPLTTQAWIYQVTGQLSLAHQTLDELAGILTPGSLHAGYHQYLAGEIALDEEQLDEAQACFQEARSAAEDIGEPGLNILARLGIARCSRLAHDYPCAATWAADALAVAEKAGYDHDRGLALVELGQISWLAGQLAPAGAFLRQAVEVLARLGAGYDLARAGLFLAVVAAQQGDPARASLFIQAASRIVQGGFEFLLARERQAVYALLAIFLNAPDGEARQWSARIARLLARFPPPPLKISLLGELKVQQGARQISAAGLKTRKAGELFALLLLSPRGCLTTEQVAEALWPEKPPGSIPQLIYHATSCLRQILEPDLPARLPSRYLELEEGQLCLTLPPGSWIDLEAFQAACKHGDWETALALYSGDFLAPYLYADWTIPMRQVVLRRLEQALLGLAETRSNQARWSDALDLACRLIAQDPWHERAVLLAMRACQELGDPAQGLRLYRDLQRTLQTDLGAEPQPDLQDLAHALAAAPRRLG